MPVTEASLLRENGTSGQDRRPLHILFVEDNPRDLQLMLALLKRSAYQLSFDKVDRPAQCREQMTRGDYDIIISDYNLRDWTAVEVLEIAKNSGKKTPVIVVSGSLGDETAVQVIKQGATDYVLKDRLARLPSAIQRALEEKRLREDGEHAAEALRTSEEHYRVLAETAAEAIFTIDDANQIVFANRATEGIFGYPAAALSGRNISLLMPGYPERRRNAPAQQQQEQAGCCQVLWRGLELSGLHKSGAEIPLEISLSESQKAGRHISTVVIRDITERKQAENQIRLQLDRLGALRAIDLAINATADLRVTLSVFLDQVTTQLGVHAADIFLLNPQTQVLESAARRGFKSPSSARNQLHLGDHPAARAVLERRIIRIANCVAERGAVLEASVQSSEHFVFYIAAPLIAKGKVSGVLELWHRAPLEPDAEWLEFLDALTGQAAIAIDNAQLYQQLQASNADLLLAYDNTLEGWVQALDLRDKETEGHTRRVTELTMRLARAYPLENDQVIHLRRGALLHDIGKMAIPDSILHKPGPLTPEEWKVMRRHPVLAHDWLSIIPFLQPAVDIPYCHHERWDGSGYPRGLKNDAIPLSARLFSVVDVWDALRSDRPYRTGWPAERVRSYILDHSGTLFDPQIVEIFLKCVKNDTP